MVVSLNIHGNLNSMVNIPERHALVEEASKNFVSINVHRTPFSAVD